MATTDGFFFDFSDSAAAPGTAATTATATTTTSPIVPAFAADIPLSRFPWVHLDGEDRDSWLAEWEPLYPFPSSAQDTKEGPRTRPLQLVLSPAGSTVSVTVCYQSAPELPALTCPRADEEEKVTDEQPALSPIDYHKRGGRDIIKGKYYGGLKVWSCAPDLAQYLAEHATEFGQLFRPSTRTAPSPVVVEVGCGQAIPALAAMALGAQRLIFMDYNEEVLQTCTRPNVVATVMAAQAAHGDISHPSPAPLSPHVQFVPGDWVRLQWDTAVDPEGCDLILGSDVTFDEEACAKLAQLLQRWLKPKTGVAYIASKVYYFGTGGGAEELAVACRQYGLQTDVVKRMDADGGMHRVILRVCKS